MSNAAGGICLRTTTSHPEQREGSLHLSPHCPNAKILRSIAHRSGRALLEWLVAEVARRINHPPPNLSATIRPV